MPVCIDPSHSVGGRFRGSDNILDIMHITAQGIIAGANMVLVDFHPDPSKALVDGPQALRMDELPHFLEDVRIVRNAYEQHVGPIRAELTCRWVAIIIRDGILGGDAEHRVSAGLSLGIAGIRFSGEPVLEFSCSHRLNTSKH